jgi:predicted ATPase
MLTALAVRNYRSLRDLVIPLRRLNVVCGANGSGKSSLYRALRLLAHTASGGLIASLAREGGLSSTLWAGPQRISREMRRGETPVEPLRPERVHLGLGFASERFSYAIDLGLPTRDLGSPFALDPEVKRECIWSGEVFRQASLLVDRRGAALRATDEAGVWGTVPQTMSAFESMLTEFVDPRTAPEMIAVREEVRSWRFYDHFRTDAEAPARQPQVGTYTPVLGETGSNLAAALETILMIGDGRALATCVDDAFPGSTIEVSHNEGLFETTMRQHGLLRPLKSAELSDGTLRYLLLIAALLTPRPPSLMVLNEPEASLHPDLIAPLGRLIRQASELSQILVVTHNVQLVEQLQEAGAGTIELVKSLGETLMEGQGLLDKPAWVWPPR